MAEKYCKYCDQTKDINDFPKDEGCLDGHWNKCQRCRSQHRDKGYFKEYQLIHKDRLREYRKRYYAEHKKYYTEYRKRYVRHKAPLTNKVNKESLMEGINKKRCKANYQKHKTYYYNKEYFRGYYQKNREHLLEYNKNKYKLDSKKGKSDRLEYYYANREKMKEKAKERYYRVKHTPQFQLSKNRNAVKRYEAIKNSKNIATLEQINKLIEDSNNQCFWCDCDIPKGEMHLDHVYPLSKGGEHSIYNMVVSCRICNSAKHAKDPEIWLDEILNKENLITLSFFSTKKIK